MEQATLAQVFVPLSFMLLFFLENNFHFVFNNSLMVCQKLFIATRWQITGINNVGLSCREIGHQLGRNHTVITKLVDLYKNTNEPKMSSTGRLPSRTTWYDLSKTSPREDRVLLRIV